MVSGKSFSKRCPQQEMLPEDTRDTFLPIFLGKVHNFKPVFLNKLYFKQAEDQL